VLHGGPDFNHAYLLPELDRLARAFRLIYYDQRGRGKSASGVVPEDVTIESEVDDLEGLRRYFGLDAIALLGHSWGCLLALEYAARYPERTDRLVLMNAAPASHADLLCFRDHRQTVERETLEKLRAIAATPAYGDGDIGVEAEYYRLHFAGALPQPDDVERIVSRLRVHFTPETIRKARAIEDRLHAQTWLLPDYDVTERFARTKTPALMIHGERDLIPLACVERIARTGPATSLLVLRGCGHFAYLERPDEVVAAVDGFFRGG
jgi:proline iminopeptidase